MGEFNDLSTVKFQLKMKPAAFRIYQEIFPGCRLEDLRENGVNVHPLDKEFGIDALIHLPFGQQWISIQEKYRKYDALKWGDFTQEFMNGCGTEYEAQGEWFKLGAQLYFYGWANISESDFAKWAILDVARYKLFVENNGGLENIGQLRMNNKFGRASFYAIPIERLRSCFIAENRGGITP